MADDWETQYHRLFEKLQETDTRWLQKFQFLSEKCKGTEEEKNTLKERLKQSEDAMGELGEEIRQYRKKEESYVHERMELMSKVTTLKTTLEGKKELFERVVRENHNEVRKLEEAARSLRRSLKTSEDNLEKALDDAKRLEQERRGLLDTIRDMEESKCNARQVKIKSNFDVVLSKYLAAFPKDDDGLRIRFVDDVTNSHSFAFLLLMKICHEDVLSNIRAASSIIPTKESMVDMVVRHQLFLELCHYARIVQCKNANTFDEAMVANAKTNEMTRHKINYEEMELCSARQQFVLALIRVSVDGACNESKDACDEKKDNGCCYDDDDDNDNDGKTKKIKNAFCMEDAMGFD